MPHLSTKRGAPSKKHCNAKFWENEKLSTRTKDNFKFSHCSGKGKVVFPALPSPTELLIHLLTAADSRGRALSIRENSSK